jgi:hypothetical protein
MHITPRKSCTQGFANAEGFDPVNFVFIRFSLYIQAVAEDDPMVDTRIDPQTLRTAKTCAAEAQRCGLRAIESMSMTGDGRKSRRRVRK